MISKKITTLKDLDFDLQLLASELDSSASNIFYLSKELMTNGIDNECFDNFIFDIEKNGDEISSLNDDTIMYSYMDEVVIIFSYLSEKYLIFDNAISIKLENKLSSYRNYMNEKNFKL